MSWDQGLNRESIHYRIASYDSVAPLHVLAGPGTGKSFAMKRRIARLIESGISPQNILVVTFTRTSAKDIISDLRSIGVDGCELVAASTLHSLCFSILSKQHVFELTGRTPRTLMDFETKCLLKDLSDEFGGLRAKDKMLNSFEAAWARLQNQDPDTILNPQDLLFHNELNRWLQFHRSMLIQELVPETRRYLYNNPLSPERFAYGHVMVDEYQDLNKAEQSLVELLADNGHLSVIGDEDQSIYSFKYAHPEGIIQFPHEHTGSISETMNECRRCPTTVVSIANSLIIRNTTRVNKLLEPFHDNGSGIVNVVQWDSIDNEAWGVAELIKHKLENGEVQAGQVLVLSPRRLIGYKIRDFLREMNIQAISSFSEEALDNREAKEAYSLLCLLTNRNDRVSLRYLLGSDTADYRKSSYAKLSRFCHENNDSPWDALEKLADGRINIPYTRQLVNRFIWIKTEIEQLSQLELDNFLENWLPNVNANIEELYSIATMILNEVDNIDDFYKEIKNKISQPEIPDIIDHVRIMSLHKSKGLSANLVIVVGCIQGLIPALPPDDISELEKLQFQEEQRRLFYVALTRCKGNPPNNPGELVLSNARRLPVADALRMGIPVTAIRGGNITIASSFFAELGNDAPVPIRGQTFLENITRVYT